MKACGVVVEYNPFHNGHHYHLIKSKEKAGADCMIAVMSGNFLQRGEPAIMDKWHRASAALQAGADLVLELPYIFAVQHSDYFSKGAVLTLAAAGVEAICFGSEIGEIEPFITAWENFKSKKSTYDETVRNYLNRGFSFPEASRYGYESIGLAEGKMDLSKPNNILGYSYVKQILAINPSIEPLTIARTNSQYHDKSINGNIASATSIRRELLEHGTLTEKASHTLPVITQEKLSEYQRKTGKWHRWEDYFQLLQYRILTSKEQDLRRIHGVDEGLEYRLKRTMRQSSNYQDFMDRLKTKRYTWTRLQRALVHILTGTTKEDARPLLDEPSLPYIRVLGMNQRGQSYLNQAKKTLEVPLLTQPQQLDHPLLEAEARASIAYYSILKDTHRIPAYQREYKAPVIIHS
ncbi:nucleotidyltransferase [Halobacillus salinarum]|uniref:tRNA(Met) cytidine acetate ligase n=1 Tax=Halobacillus salinarum TaxID=2932257 RepID=A0ABY4EFA6_9BACI|nr:nucleotidyltransferase [Halobacillus salinarum]UOQ43148.1 nucleotidyltransferase [Halobacillus salinarum]